LNGVLKGREFKSSNESEEPITKVWDELAFYEAQSVFRNHLSRLARVIENGGDDIIE
jgi:hypothetical protein